VVGSDDSYKEAERAATETTSHRAKFGSILFIVGIKTHVANSEYGAECTTEESGSNLASRLDAKGYLGFDVDEGPESAHYVLRKVCLKKGFPSFDSSLGCWFYV